MPQLDSIGSFIGSTKDSIDSAWLYRFDGFSFEAKHPQSPKLQAEISKNFEQPQELKENRE